MFFLYSLQSKHFSQPGYYAISFSQSYFVYLKKHFTQCGQSYIATTTKYKIAITKIHYGRKEKVW